MARQNKWWTYYYSLSLAPHLISRTEDVGMDSDDKWFNNPQIRFTITKTVRTMYISLMQSDNKISNTDYGACSFCLFQIKVKEVLIVRISTIDCGSL